MRDFKKEDITIIGVVICWSENEELNKLKNKQSFTAKEFEKLCEKHDEILNSDKNKLGYDKTKYQVLYFVNSERDISAKAYVDRVDIGDGKEYMPTEDMLKEIIANMESTRNQEKAKSEEFEM